MLLMGSVLCTWNNPAVAEEVLAQIATDTATLDEDVTDSDLVEPDAADIEDDLAITSVPSSGTQSTHRFEAVRGSSERPTQGFLCSSNQ